MMLKASPLMHGVGRGLSSITFYAAKAVENDLAVPETVCTVAKGTDCATAEGTVSDTHGQRHVYAITCIHRLNQQLDKFNYKRGALIQKVKRWVINKIELASKEIVPMGTNHVKLQIEQLY